MIEVCQHVYDVFVSTLRADDLKFRGSVTMCIDEENVQRLLDEIGRWNDVPGNGSCFFYAIAQQLGLCADWLRLQFATHLEARCTDAWMKEKFMYFTALSGADDGEYDPSVRW